MAARRAEAVVRNRDVRHDRVGQCADAGADVTPGSNDAQTVRDAIANIQRIEADPGNAFVVQAKLQGRPPCPAWIVPSATVQVASLDNRTAAEVVISDGKGRADQYAAAVGHVLEQAILDPVALAAIEGSTIGEKSCFPRAVGDHV